MLSGLTWPMVALLLCAGALLDWQLGEVRRWHPLIGFGNWAHAIERRLNRGGARFARGGTAWLLAVLPPVALAWLLCGAAGMAGDARDVAGVAAVGMTATVGIAGIAAHAAMLYFCLGLRSLGEHNLPIAQALASGDLAQARRLTARIVSRDTAHASAGDLAKASTESLLENGNDAVFGTLFWFAVAGGPGAVLFRLANTLDAMWGYRSARFLRFGWAAARIDDALNYVPARLTALSYLLLAPTLDAKRRAWRCWRTQARHWSSPNGGPVMASGAGALGVALGGAATYDGVVEQRPPLGAGKAVEGSDIGRAWRLVARTTVLWLSAAALAAVALVFLGHAHA